MSYCFCVTCDLTSDPHFSPTACEHGYGRSLTFWGKLMLSVVLWVTGRNLSMELEVTLPPYMDTVNLILNILRLEQFYFFQYGAKRYPIRSQPILTEATHNFSPKNRRDFHEHLLSRNFNCDLCKCRSVLPSRFLVLKCKWEGKGDLSCGKKGLSRGGGVGGGLVLDQHLCIGESLRVWDPDPV